MKRLNRPDPNRSDLPRRHLRPIVGRPMMILSARLIRYAHTYTYDEDND